MCDFSKCICAKDFEERYTSCNPDKSSIYTYLENCGTPAAIIETTADTNFLQVRRPAARCITHSRHPKLRPRLAPSETRVLICP
jgi:hypothetical protein